MKIFCLIPLFATILPTIRTFNTEIIVKFCQSKRLYSTTIFDCSPKPERVRLFRKITTNGIGILMIDLNNFRNFTNILDSAAAFVADGDCAEFPSFIAQVGENYFFEKHHWLVVTARKFQFQEVFKQAALNINSNVNLAVFNSSGWSIYDIYNQAYRHNGRLIIGELGFFNSTIGYRAKLETNKFWIRRNMSGVVFKSAVVVPNSRIKLDEYLYSEERRQENSMHRFQSTTIRYCRDFFNFTLDIERTESWGYRQQNGNFDGLVGLLERKLVDFGSSPLLLKFDRLPVVDYSYGNWILRSTFIYRRPKIEVDSYEIFLRPLSDSVWICVFCVLILAILLLKIVLNQETKLYNDWNDRIDNWSTLFLLILGVICQQGLICHPRLFSSRTLLISTLLFSVLIYQFYSASIVSYLLMEPPRIINNLKDLADSNLKAGIEDILIDRNYFKQTTDPIAIDLYNRKIKGQTNNDGFYQPQDGLNLVKIGGFAYHVETSTAYPIIGELFTNQEICELEEVQLYPTQPMYTNLQKRSPFREILNYCMLEQVDKGIMHRLRNYWDTKKPICIKSMKADINVNLHEFSYALFILACGSCLSLIFLIYEILYEHKSEHKSATIPFVD